MRAKPEIFKTQTGSSKDPVSYQHELEVRCYFNHDDRQRIQSMLDKAGYAWEGNLARFHYEGESPNADFPFILLEHEAKIYNWCSLETAVVRLQDAIRRSSTNVVYSNDAKSILKWQVSSDIKYVVRKIL